MTRLTLDHALAWLRSGHIAPPEGALSQNADTLDEDAKLFAQVFSGRAGERVLQRLLEATLFRPAVDHRLAGDDYLRFAQLREGENGAAAVILAYLDRAEHLGRTDHAATRGTPYGPGPIARFVDDAAQPAAGDPAGGPAAGWDDPGSAVR